MTVFYCGLIIALSVWIARLTKELRTTQAALESAQDTAIKVMEEHK